MITKDVFYRREWQGRVFGTGLNESQAVALSNKSETRFDNNTIVWTKRILAQAAGNQALDLVTGSATADDLSVYQVAETTIVAAGGCTSNGNLALVITGAGITGSPLTVNVPLTTALHTSDALIAAQCRDTLNAVAALVAAKWSFSVSGPDLIATRTEYLANDATFNMAIPGARGVTADATSSITTAGIVATVITNAGTQDVYGKPLPAEMTLDLCEIVCVAGLSNITLDSGLSGSVTLRTGDSLTIRAGTLLEFESSEDTQIDIVFFGH